LLNASLELPSWDYDGLEGRGEERGRGVTGVQAPHTSSLEVGARTYLGYLDAFTVVYMFGSPFSVLYFHAQDCLSHVVFLLAITIDSCPPRCSSLA
jgi:hypothetical protein